MPRIARAVASGFPHHVVQRGNNRQSVFFYEEDRRRYLTLLENPLFLLQTLKPPEIIVKV